VSPFDLVGLVVVALAITRIFGPLASGVADRIRGVRPPARDAAETAELQQLQDRLAEVEERLDFAERLLASREQPEPLPGGARR
jgi:hypothetical protein